MFLADDFKTEKQLKVLLVNGSPHPHGCTYTALNEIATELNKYNIDTEIFHIGNSPVNSCIDCRQCRQTGHCVFNKDCCNALIDKITDSDGLILGAPVHFGSAASAFCTILDRTFYAAFKAFRFKPAAAIVSCRRGGASAAFDRLNKYFTFSQMPVVSSQYWNSVHGWTPEDVLQDKEGLQTMRTLGKNMAWMLHSIEQSNIRKPVSEEWIETPFIQN